MSGKLSCISRFNGILSLVNLLGVSGENCKYFMNLVPNNNVNNVVFMLDLSGCPEAKLVRI